MHPDFGVPGCAAGTAATPSSPCFRSWADPPAWTRDQLEELNARDIEYNGKLYTRYEINQMQRARERNVHRWKNGKPAPLPRYP